MQKNILAGPVLSARHYFARSEDGPYVRCYFYRPRLCHHNQTEEEKDCCRLLNGHVIEEDVLCGGEEKVFDRFFSTGFQYDQTTYIY